MVLSSPQDSALDLGGLNILMAGSSSDVRNLINEPDTQFHQAVRSLLQAHNAELDKLQAQLQSEKMVRSSAGAVPDLPVALKVPRPNKINKQVSIIEPPSDPPATLIPDLNDEAHARSSDFTPVGSRESGTEVVADGSYRTSSMASNAWSKIQQVMTTGKNDSEPAPPPGQPSSIEELFRLASGTNLDTPDSRLACIVNSMWFEGTFAGLIITNTIIMVLEVQYNGSNIGNDMNFPDAGPRGDSVWPDAGIGFNRAEFFCGIVFTIELLLKMAGQKYRFIRSTWNIFDLIVVISWFFSEVMSQKLFVNPMILRLVRLMRIIRVVRLLKGIQALDSLHVLVRSIQASVSILAWASLLLMVLLTMFGLSTYYLLVDYMTDTNNTLEERQAVFFYFGTFTRTVYTLFEATLGNFSPVMRTLMLTVSEMWGPFFVMFKCVVGFAVVRVISGVFLHETFRIANTDDDLMVRRRNRDLNRHIKKMQLLFKAADAEHTGALSYHEFAELMSSPVVQTWLQAYEVNVSDMRLFFHLLDDGDGSITAEELVQGVAKLKGAAKSVDIHSMQKDVGAIKQLATNVNDALHALGYTSTTSEACKDKAWKRFRVSVCANAMPNGDGLVIDSRGSYLDGDDDHSEPGAQPDVETNTLANSHMEPAALQKAAKFSL